MKATEAEFARREADAEQASRIITRAERDGAISTDLIRQLYRLGNELRRYREHDIHCAAGAYCEALLTGGSPLVRFEAFATALHLSEEERIGAARALAVKLLTPPEIESPIDAVDQVFAARSDVRRVRRRERRRM